MQLRHGWRQFLRMSSGLLWVMNTVQERLFSDTLTRTFRTVMR